MLNLKEEKLNNRSYYSQSLTRDHKNSKSKSSALCAKIRTKFFLPLSLDLIALGRVTQLLANPTNLNSFSL